MRNNISCHEEREREIVEHTFERHASEQSTTVHRWKMHFIKRIKRNSINGEEEDKKKKLLMACWEREREWIYWVMQEGNLRSFSLRQGNRWSLWQCKILCDSEACNWECCRVLGNFFASFLLSPHNLWAALGKPGLFLYGNFLQSNRLRRRMWMKKKDKL